MLVKSFAELRTLPPPHLEMYSKGIRELTIASPGYDMLQEIHQAPHRPSLAETADLSTHPQLKVITPGSWRALSPSADS